MNELFINEIEYLDSYKFKKLINYNWNWII